MTRLSLLSDHVTVSRQGGHCLRGRRPDMSDDIRRKKKKQGRRPKNTDEKEKEIAGRDKKEPEPVTVSKEKSEPDPSNKQEKQSVLFKALFFCGILGKIWSGVSQSVKLCCRSSRTDRPGRVRQCVTRRLAGQSGPGLLPAQHPAAQPGRLLSELSCLGCCPEHSLRTGYQ